MKPSAGASIRVPNVYAADGTKVEMLGRSGALEWKQAGRDIVVGATHNGPYVAALKISPAPQQLVRD